MESKYKIGQKVYIVKNFKIEEVVISKINITSDTLNYEFKNKYWTCSQNELYVTKAKAQIQLDIFNNKLKFHIGDIVIGNVKYSNYNNTKTKNVLGKVVEIYLDKDKGDFVYQLSSIDTNGWNSIDRGYAKDLTKVKDNFIEDYGNVTDLMNQLDDLENAARKIQKEISDIYNNLDKELHTSYKKHTSYFNFDKMKYSDRFVKNDD